ncbi:MAG: hypothetical protein E7I42_16555 [Pluralibacter gergoviae]|nr:hypothetical protein [Pluralibacter gergoviae]
MQEHIRRALRLARRRLLNLLRQQDGGVDDSAGNVLDFADYRPDGVG